MKETEVTHGLKASRRTLEHTEISGVSQLVEASGDLLLTKAVAKPKSNSVT